MNRNSLIDCILCLIVRLLGAFLRKLPLRFSLLIGEAIGRAGYCLRKKRRRIAYVNLKAAFGSKKTPRELTAINKEAFCNLGRNLIEVLLLPKINKRYADKYFRIDGIEEVDRALKAGKGVIILTAHLGNWELASLALAMRGYPMKVLARQQKFRRLDALLISYRESKGCRVISKGMATREIFKSLRNNEIVGILTDQDAGTKGVFINFFGRDASTHQGAIKFALREKSVVLPAFTIRDSGPYHRIIIKPPLELKRTDNLDPSFIKNRKVYLSRLENNIKISLKQFTSYLEDLISSYPSQWLWQHKRWKSTPSRSIIILSDGKAGHLNQSRAVAKAIEKTYSPARLVTSKVIEVKFKNGFAQNLLAGCVGFACSVCQGCMKCLKLCLKRESYQKLTGEYADIVISAGRSLCATNLIVSRENYAKSIVLMKPPSFLLNSFNLVIAPRHDNLRLGVNIAVTEAAPNLIDLEYLKEQSGKLGMRLDDQNLHLGDGNTEGGLRVGVLIGGDTPYFRLSKELMQKVIDEILKVSSQLNAELIFSTSRRTSEEIDGLLKQRLAHFDLCKLLVIANQNNIEEAVGGILGLSQIVVVSGESISMVSEAASSGKYVIVFKPENKISQRSNKDKRFLDYLNHKGFITLIQPDDLAETIKRIWAEKPAYKVLDDNRVICEAVRKLL